MGLKRIIRIVLGCAALLLLWLYLPRAAKDVHAQFAGYFAEQTVTYSVSVTQTNPPATYYSLPNIGQAGHSLQVGTVSGHYVRTGAGCPIWLEGSEDNLNWIVLTSASTVNGAPLTSFANGYYPYLRLAVNPASASSCATAFILLYTGYQFPPTLSPGSVNFVDSVAGITSIDNVTSVWPNLQILTQINCFNPGAGGAYLQIYDSTAPTLGTGILFQTAIPATSSFISSVNVMGSQHLQAAAVTAWNGSTAVSTALDCTFGINQNGPFYY